MNHLYLVTVWWHCPIQLQMVVLYLVKIQTDLRLNLNLLYKFPGKKINMEPIPDKNTVNLLSFFLLIILSLVLMNFETSIELKKIATINEDPNTIERVKGK